MNPEHLFEGETENDDYTVEEASWVLDMSLTAISEERRPAARLRLLETLADGHRQAGVDYPEWLTVLLDRERSRKGPGEG